MIGNDIIDLNLAKKSHRWKTKRFAEIIFSPEEQLLIQDSGSNRFELIWLLWSMKESAYKVHMQKGNEPSFAPHKINCRLGNKWTGRATIDNQVYLTNSRISEHCIYTISSCTNKKSIIDKYTKVDLRPNISLSELSYKTTLAEYSKFINTTCEMLNIMKNNHGIPQIYLNNQLQSVSLSITHHGQFFGYAIAG